MCSKKGIVKSAVHNALRLMREDGFEIAGRLEVKVDPNLSFMGYATKRRGNNVIVVSGKALKSGLIEGLLIHELCHIYRIQQGHPSHNFQLLNSVGLHLIHEYRLTEDYQITLVQDAVNHIQDLYADDIAFKVFSKSQIFPSDQAFNFFLDWIQEAPIKSKAKQTRWRNVGIMLNNCFAISNMRRHDVPDIGNQAQDRMQKFLSNFGAEIKAESNYFRDLMTNLQEDIAEKDLEGQLTEYLIRVLTLAKKHSAH